MDEFALMVPESAIGRLKLTEKVAPERPVEAEAANPRIGSALPWTSETYTCVRGSAGSATEIGVSREIAPVVGLIVKLPLPVVVVPLLVTCNWTVHPPWLQSMPVAKAGTAKPKPRLAIKTTSKRLRMGDLSGWESQKLIALAISNPRAIRPRRPDDPESDTNSATSLKALPSGEARLGTPLPSSRKTLSLRAVCFPE